MQAQAREAVSLDYPLAAVPYTMACLLLITHLKTSQSVAILLRLVLYEVIDEKTRRLFRQLQKAFVSKC